MPDPVNLNYASQSPTCRDPLTQRLRHGIQATVVVLALPHVLLWLLLASRKFRLMDLWGEGRFGFRALPPAAVPLLGFARFNAYCFLPSVIALIGIAGIIAWRVRQRRACEWAFDLSVPIVLAYLAYRYMETGFILAGV